MTDVAIDFDKVETLRKHLLLSKTHMAEVLGVTRVSYHQWLLNTRPTRKSIDKLKVSLQKIIEVMTAENWPDTEVLGMSSARRKEHLLALMSVPD